MNQNPNPLRQFFRQPAIYFRLPSGGNYWPAGTVDIPENQDLPVFPMTAIDEITYRTPDSLFSGQASVSVVQSCIPNIKDAWEMPSVDLNAILVAIRIASYGHSMDITTECPACGHQGEYTADLRVSLEQIRSGDYAQGQNWGEMQFSFKPMSYRQQNQLNLAQFEQQKLIQNIQNSDLPEEEKIERLGQCLQSVTELTIESLANCTQSIRTASALVTEREHIVELYHNCDRKLFTDIRDFVINLREPSEMPLLNVECENCSHAYKQALIMDQSNFFGNAS
jgi:hypothetical protein